MKTIDNYFKTENEHWNKAVFNLYNKAIESGLFANDELPLKMFDEGVNIILNKKENPVLGVTELLKELENLEAPQQLFLLDEIASYFKYTVFDGDEPLKEIYTLLNSHLSRMQPKKPEAGNLRETLKTFVMDELETLPETIKELEPGQRLNIVCKLMPFVMPRVESVHFEKGEGNGWSL